MARGWQLRAPDGTPITATTGCLDGHDVSLLHLPADLGRQLLAAQEIAADSSRFAAVDAARPVAAAVGEQREAGGVEETHRAGEALAPPGVPLPPRVVEPP